MKPGQLHQILQPKMLEIQKYLIRLGAPAADAEDIVQDTVYKALCILIPLMRTNSVHGYIK